MQTRLFADPDFVQFYDIENGWADDDRFCQKLALGKRTVLDLGCGTGRLATALSLGREVFGVDPAAAMLTAARQRERGSAVTWIEADARSIRLGRRFELILLTGHAFQVFLTDEDQQAVCDTIAAHLAPGEPLFSIPVSLPAKSGGGGSQAARCDQSHILLLGVSTLGTM